MSKSIIRTANKFLSDGLNRNGTIARAAQISEFHPHNYLYSTKR